MVQRRTTKPRMDFFSDRTTANHLTPLEHERLQPALREITRGHKAVVTTADNCDVVVIVILATDYTDEDSA